MKIKIEVEFEVERWPPDGPDLTEAHAKLAAEDAVEWNMGFHDGDAEDIDGEALVHGDEFGSCIVSLPAIPTDCNPKDNP